MADLREKVIRGMECMVQISGKGCKECKYTKECDGSIATMYAGTVQMTIDALSLLKAQEPRVMELEEIKAAAFGGGMYWLEFRSICAPALMIEQKANYKIEFAVLHSRGYGPVMVGQFHPNEYKKVWRCWTSRPTDEQREAVKWE